MEIIRYIVAMLLYLSAFQAQDFVNLTFDNPDLTGSLTPVLSEFPGGPFRGEASWLLRG